MLMSLSSIHLRFLRVLECHAAVNDLPVDLIKQVHSHSRCAEYREHSHIELCDDAALSLNQLVQDS